MLQDLILDLEKLKNPPRVAVLQYFFKTGKGQYGENDIFLGLTNPQLHSLAKKYAKTIDIEELAELLYAAIHEYRAVALFILLLQYQQAKRAHISTTIYYQFYLNLIDQVNNWDLVDCSAPQLLGDYLIGKNTEILYELAHSKKLFRNRVAMVAQLAFIRKNLFDDLFPIALILLKHPHDLIHKAVGWMLREAWKREPKPVEFFIQENYVDMHRTTLRYAIEKMPEPQRKWFLNFGKN
ncbi:MAG: DNA alkylation repair protein [Sediminibacterium sp.]|nr:DNA alkylation repair protein [Sediminibacterium sp.]